MSDAGNTPKGNDSDDSHLDSITLSELRAAEKDPRHSLRDPSNPRHGKYLKAKRGMAEMAQKFQDPVRGIVVPDMSLEAWKAMADSSPDMSGLAAEALKDSMPNFSELVTGGIKMPEFDQLRESSSQINEMVTSLLDRTPHRDQDIQNKAITPEARREHPEPRPGTNEGQLRLLQQMLEKFERRIDIAEQEAQLRSQNAREAVEEERKQALHDLECVDPGLQLPGVNE